MKQLRIFCLLLLVISVAAFGYCRFRQRSSTDKSVPVIKIEKTALKISTKAGKEALKKSVTAYDAKDGNVTDTLVVEGISDFLDQNRRLVTFAAFDSSNHVSKATRQITYTDYHAPRFELSAPMKFVKGETVFLKQVTVDDCLDQNLDEAVHFSDGYYVTTDVAGDYPVQLEVTNSAGDTAYLPLTISIFDSSAQEQEEKIQLYDYIRYIKKDEHPNLEKNRKPTKLKPKEQIKISDQDVKYDKPGVYEVKYTLLSDNKETAVTRMILVVEE